MPRNASDKFDFGELLELQELPDTKMIYRQECLHCKKLFETKRNGVKYCSKDCVSRYWDKNNPKKRAIFHRNWRGRNKDRVKDRVKEWNKNWARGLLCKKCNLGIGLLGDNSLLLNKALVYLISAEQVRTK